MGAHASDSNVVFLHHHPAWVQPLERQRIEAMRRHPSHSANNRGIAQSDTADPSHRPTDGERPFSGAS